MLTDSGEQTIGLAIVHARQSDTATDQWHDELGPVSKVREDKTCNSSQYG